MTSDYFQRVRDLFAAARALPQGQRDAYVLEHAAEDASLRDEVLSLLTHDGEEADGFLDPHTAPVDLRTVAEDHFPPPMPTEIGGYRIVRELGEGGMAVVYEAEQQNPRRPVALKVIRAVRLSRNLRHRFEHEAELLARLEHPGIARIYEAGTFDSGIGRSPFFAMELVRGPTLTQYAVDKKLNIRQRLELLARVCDAVQHAHQRGVIHRDLKPANILVDESGQPKVLDFGVARTTQRDLQTVTIQTNTGQLVGTLPYMSPEQAGGEVNQLDTRSDVYALGVIGFELLAGRLPYLVKERSIPEAVRIIREEPPSRLSSLDRAVGRDIETIIAKALEKEKDRRYGGAGDLAADIRRYLNSEPISARPSSTWYQASRFTKRNKVLVSGLAATFAVLLAGIVTTYYQKRQADNSRKRAEQVQTSLSEILSSLNPSNAVGGKVDPLDILDRAARQMEQELAQQPLARAQMQEIMSVLYANWGRADSGLPLIERAVAAIEADCGPNDVKTHMARANLGHVLNKLGRWQDAETALRPAVAGLRRTMGESDRDTLSAMNNLAFALKEQKQSEEAVTLFRRIVDLRQRESGDDHQEPGVLNNLADALLDIDQYEEAVAVAGEAVRRAEAQSDPDSALYSYFNTLGKALEGRGSMLEAEQALLRSMELRKKAFGPDSSDIHKGLASLAGHYQRTKRPRDGLPLARRLYESRTISPLGPQSAAMVSTYYGLCLEALDELADAETALKESLRLLRATGQTDSPAAEAARAALIRVYRRTGRPDDAARIEASTQPAANPR